PGVLLFPDKRAAGPFPPRGPLESRLVSLPRPSNGLAGIPGSRMESAVRPFGHGKVPPVGSRGHGYRALPPVSLSGSPFNGNSRRQAGTFPLAAAPALSTAAPRKGAANRKSLGSAGRSLHPAEPDLSIAGQFHEGR